MLYINFMETTNQKSIMYRYTHKKRERNPNITQKAVIKSQGKRAKEEERNKKEPQNKLTKWQ